MDSSETSSNSQLNSNFSHPLSGAGAFPDAECSEPSERGPEDANAARRTHRTDRASAAAPSRRPKHRIAEVRDSQAVSLRTVSRRSGVAVRILRQQEQPHTDLRLSELMVWAKALEVPLRELLAEPEDSLCATVAQRAQMVRLMKTVEAMRAHAKVGSVRQISDAVRQQLLEIMPELEDITAWPKEGSRRPAGGIGRTGMQPVQIERIEPPSQNDVTG